MSKHHLIKRFLVSGLVIAAVSFPATAQARVSVDPPAGSSAPLVSGSSVHRQLDQLQANVRQLFAAEGGWHLNAFPVPATASPDAAFQWGDAGIGAAGAVVLLGAGTLGARATRRRRRPVVS